MGHEESSTQTGYECFDELIRELCIGGHIATADKLDFMLHRVSWTTRSELIGELGLAILVFQRCEAGVSVELQRKLVSCMSAVREVWPDIKCG